MNTDSTPVAPPPAPAPQGKMTAMRFLADAASSPALYNKVRAGDLMKFVGDAGWKSPGRRQYALSAAGVVEQYRLAKRIVRDHTFGDQALPWGSIATAPARVRRAAQKLQFLAILDLSEVALAALPPNQAGVEEAGKAVRSAILMALKAAPQGVATPQALPNTSAQKFV